MPNLILYNYMETKRMNYLHYLNLDELLSLQVPQSNPPAHSETLFIITHQTYELWFKELLHEFGKIKRDFHHNNLHEVIHTFKRVCAIMKILVGQVDAIETITPMEFASFRSSLKTASGFQSLQYWQLEFTLGNKCSKIINCQTDEYARSQLEQILHQPSVYSYFYDFLEFWGVMIPQELRDRDHSLPTLPHPAIQDGLLILYSKAGDVTILLELMLDFDQSFQQWRYRHLQLAERTIGNMPGTGKSTGISYLMQSVFRTFFPDLLAIRSRFYN
ncbi:MAG TPA: tryptophan 2,3-dioxygenase family protein [Nostocaceae cyanobacterium]|nr:tryptophan 2,3-dioxygenase family protein [Nostocaceae cyanobacterium]